MGRRVTRRQLLRGSAALLASAPLSRVVTGRQPAGSDGFDPVEHGFGFRNWSPRSQYFEAPPVPERVTIREALRRDWEERSRPLLGLETGSLPTPLVDVIATHLQTTIEQYAGTNGHCYGMSLAAQQYYEDPASIPVDRPTASEIDDPTVPLDRPEAPVYETIIQLQAAQFLRLRAWLGRRALLNRHWIDTAAVLDDIRAVIETLGTASLQVFDESVYAHQVLAYGYRDHGDQVAVPIYDPNRRAQSYRAGQTTLWFDRIDSTATMRQYGRYTGVLFNRYDRIERATGRTDATPFDHLQVDRSTVRTALFPIAVVQADTKAVDLVVVDPEGEPFERIRGQHMDPSRGEYPRHRVRYGVTPGTYRIGLFGKRETEYELRAMVSGLDGSIVDAARTARIGAGEGHGYTLEVPASGSGRLERTGQSDHRSALVTGTGAVGGIAAGALGYRLLRNRRRGGSVGGRPP